MEGKVGTQRVGVCVTGTPVRAAAAAGAVAAAMVTVALAAAVQQLQQMLQRSPISFNFFHLASTSGSCLVICPPILFFLLTK